MTKTTTKIYIGCSDSSSVKLVRGLCVQTRVPAYTKIAPLTWLSCPFCIYPKKKSCYVSSLHIFQLRISSLVFPKEWRVLESQPAVNMSLGFRWGFPRLRWAKHPASPTWVCRGGRRLPRGHLGTAMASIPDSASSTGSFDTGERAGRLEVLALKPTTSATSGGLDHSHVTPLNSREAGTAGQSQEGKGEGLGNYLPISQ